MMKKLFFLFLLLPVHRVFSQDPFTKFVEKKQVRFATYLVDTFHFSNPNLSLVARTLLANGSVKARIPVEQKNERMPGYAGIEDIRARISPNRESKVMDADGNITGTVVEAGDALLSSRYFDEQTSDLVEIPQILYIESGQLKSYVPYFSTKYAVFTSWGQKLGISNAFNTGFNKDRSASKRDIKNARMLGATSTTIRLDTIKQENLLKQLYGQNLLEGLWPSIGKKQYQIYRIDSMTRIAFEDLRRGLFSSTSVPIYDEEGKLTDTKVSPIDLEPLHPSAFVSMQLKQNWFYNERKNILFSTITELILHATKGAPVNGEQILTPILKILLK
jgi:hypothetical protein